MRHWYISDGNHSHYLVLARSEKDALDCLFFRLRGDGSDIDRQEFVENYSAEWVPDIARIDEDSGMQYR